MALTPAERAKRYRDRQRSDPALKARYLQKERTRKKSNYVPVSERSARAQRKIRRSWRESSKNYRENRSSSLHPDSSKSNPPTQKGANAVLQSPRRLQVDQRTKRGRKKVKKDRARAYRQLRKTEQLLASQGRLTERWKKRYSRVKDQLCAMKDSPRSKTRKLLNHFPVNKEVTKKLVFHHVLLDELRDKYRQNKMRRYKQKIRRIAANSIIKKYRMVKRMSAVLGVNGARVSRKDIGQKLKYERVQRSDRVHEEIKKRVADFFQRDDSSRLMPGKKDVITRNKVQQQKRLLNDHLTVLHAKYLSENPDTKLHYSTFCKLRPWWVVKPTISDLESCMCKRCTNMDLMNEKLAAHRVTTTVEEAMKSAVCDMDNKACMYGECQTCQGKRVAFQLPAQDKDIEYQQWTTKEKQYGDGKSTNITVKETFKLPLSSLCEKYEAELKHRYTTHRFNILHQYSELRKLKANLDENSVIVHIDFSENYICKYSAEIQSVHFGGSHQQASLHTGVYYTVDGCHSFCTISDCTRHDPSAIWAHLDPVLREIKKRYPAVSTVHFISDGPTTQYRNKKNFWLGSTIPKSMGFDTITWNFTEAGHGKGAPDGIGGVLKRLADNLIAHGKDIPNAHALYDSLKHVTNVTLSEVTEEEIKQFDAKTPTDLIPVQGTMKLHQLLFTNDPEIVQHRELSCFCNGIPCFKTTQARLRKTGKKTTKERTNKDTTTKEKTPGEKTSKERRPEEKTTEDSKNPKEKTTEENTRKGKTKERTPEEETPEKKTPERRTSEEVTPDESTTEETSTEETSTEERVVKSKDSILKPVTSVNAKVGEFCVISYEGQPYPGVINDIDEDSVEVNSMAKVGRNRFFWPMREDKIWYTYDSVITWIPPPEKVTNRHHQIAADFWKEIIVQLGIE